MLLWWKKKYQISVSLNICFDDIKLLFLTKSSYNTLILLRHFEAQYCL